MANLSQHQRRWQKRKNDRRDRTHSPQKYLKDGFARMEVSRNYETECETSHNYRNFLQYCNQEINVSANKRTQTPRCMARILVTKNPIKWWQNLPGAVKRSHEVFGMDGEDGFITSLYRRESRRPQQGSLGHIIQWWFKIDEIVLLDCHWVPRNSNLFEILRVVYYNTVPWAHNILTLQVSRDNFLT